MREDTEEVILAAAAELLERGGPAALTTRAVCEAAGIKSPTLYHHFGDKDGLSAALVRRGLAQFMARKRAVQDTDDPLQQLRAGWDEAVAFALQRPALHALYTQQLRQQPALAAEAYGLVRARVQRLVDRQVFRIGVDDAARAVWAGCNGVLSLVAQGAARREVEAASALLFDAIVAQLQRDRPEPGA
ncbi:helix-turn-helix domain-containing protein [Piscinibacter sakaiensis]|uniref:Transcriptional regulator, TetR family n=1 Tax=Piscinibacter sakaiensis TaxID=1547922 RepID=A0A0K8P5N3_PISS1|nr:TetR/AcrR family transcriptional regulator [Piscinibacter sakaiensis]GAP37809.1 transcriptional regulator, TetR family [Piscinibacter sakaiensis]